MYARFISLDQLHVSSLGVSFRLLSVMLQIALNLHLILDKMFSIYSITRLLVSGNKFGPLCHNWALIPWISVINICYIQNKSPVLLNYVRNHTKPGSSFLTYTFVFSFPSESRLKGRRWSFSIRAVSFPIKIFIFYPKISLNVLTQLPTQIIDD